MNRNLQLIRAAMLNVHSPTLKADTAIAIKHFRDFAKAYRAGAYDNQNGWECGRQDAWGDKVDRMIFAMRANILAYAIKNGDTRRFKKLAEEID